MTYNDACGSVVQCSDPVDSGIVVDRHDAVHLLASRRLASHWYLVRTRGHLRRLVQGDVVTSTSAGRRPRTAARTVAWTTSRTSSWTCTLRRRRRQVFDLVVRFFVIWNSGSGGCGLGSGAADCVTHLVADVDYALTRWRWRLWSLGQVLAHPVFDVVPDDVHQVLAVIDQLRCSTPASHHNIVAQYCEQYIANSHQQTCFRLAKNLINVRSGTSK